jgi:hypothetical protein
VTSTLGIGAGVNRTERWYEHDQRVSDAAYGGTANRMSGKWISIERPPCARAFAVSVAS